MEKFVYRAVNPRSDADMLKLANLERSLQAFCNSEKQITKEHLKWSRIHMGAVEYFDDYKGKELLPLEENADEFVYVCEAGDEFVGYVEVCSYHVVDGKRPDDDIGILHEIYVKDEYRGGEIAYRLLQMGIDKLLQKNKTRAICNVQEDNPNRHLHFAMAGKNVIDQKEIKRCNGKKTIDYTLLIDLNNLKKKSMVQLARDSAKIRREMGK